MRRFTQVVTIPAGGVWPDVEGGRPLPYFHFAYIQNRAVPGSGNDLWVGFGGSRPTAGDISTADEVVPAGSFLTYNLAGSAADELDADATHQLFIRNVGATAVVCKVELDQEPIEVTSQPVIAGGTSVVTGAQTPADGLANPTDAVDVRAFLEVQDTNGNWYRAGAARTSLDAQNANNRALIAAAFDFGWNPLAGGWDRLRVPVVFKTVVASVLGATAVWTPAAGKRFRLMAYSIELTGDASLAAAGRNEITLTDAAAAIGQGVSAWLPAAAGAVLGNVPLSGGMRSLGNGYLSAAINNPLNVNLGAALATGEIRVNAIGTEE